MAKKKWAALWAAPTIAVCEPRPAGLLPGKPYIIIK